ncbi:hypothetical protein ABPG72_001043 [Tetrahymena utriculariae]
MSQKSEIANLLQLQLHEIKDHKHECQDKECKVSIEILQSVVDCIIEDLQEENRDWTISDINDWKSTLDNQGLCDKAMDIFQFILDCLYKSKSFVADQSNFGENDSQTLNNKSQITNSTNDTNNQVDNFFQTQIDESSQSEIIRKREIQKKIKQLEESIEMKQRIINDTENQIQQKLDDNYETSEQNEGWVQFEREKISYLKEKSKILSQLEDVFLEIDAIQELVQIREEIKNCIENYDFNKIQSLQKNLDQRLQNYSFIIEDIRSILQVIENWEQKYPLCTDKSVGLFIDIEKDNQYLNQMLKQVNNVYNDQMLSELEGLHDVLSELEQIKIQNNNNK